MLTRPSLLVLVGLSVASACDDGGVPAAADAFTDAAQKPDASPPPPPRPTVFAFDQQARSIFRFDDDNDDGDMLDVGEVYLFFDQTVAGLGVGNAPGLLAENRRMLLATDTTGIENVVRLSDTNDDGDAFDDGEANEWFDGILPSGLELSTPLSLRRGSDQSVLLVENNAASPDTPEALYGLRDTDDSGNVAGPEEVSIFFAVEDIGVDEHNVVDIAVDADGRVYAFNVGDTIDDIKLFRIGEGHTDWSEFLTGVQVYDAVGLALSQVVPRLGFDVKRHAIVLSALENGTQGAFVAARDANEDGILSADELSVIWRESSDASDLALAAKDFALLADGSIVFADFASGSLVHLRDQNDDGDMLDEDELRVLYSREAAEAAGLPSLLAPISIAVATI